MTVTLDVEGRQISFTLDWKQSCWQSGEQLDESLFPLIAIVDDRRYELYSDGTFAEVEK
jgi:hypothetical protein